MEELFDVIQPVHLIQTFILTVNTIISNLPWERILLDLINMGQFNNEFKNMKKEKRKSSDRVLY